MELEHDLNNKKMITNPFSSADEIHSSSSDESKQSSNRKLTVTQKHQKQVDKDVKE